VCGTHETSQEIGDVGHPTFCCRYRKPVIDLPTRPSESAPRDDKGKGNGSIESRCRSEVFFITEAKKEYA
jgi:hypothetical protein